MLANESYTKFMECNTIVSQLKILEHRNAQNSK